MSKKKTDIEFEQSIKELEQLVEAMEKENLSLEDSLRHYERGVALSRACQQALSEAEQKVKLLQSDGDGQGESGGDGELSDFPSAEETD